MEKYKLIKNSFVASHQSYKGGNSVSRKKPILSTMGGDTLREDEKVENVIAYIKTLFK